VLCKHCNKSNPIRDLDRFEQTCIFCGQPFIVSRKKETKLVSKPVGDNNNRIPEEPPINQLEDVNQTKPISRNKLVPKIDRYQNTSPWMNPRINAHKHFAKR
jgi:hypothetical protein